MKSLRCKCGSHDHVERHRVTIGKETWCMKNGKTLKQTPNSEYIRTKQVVILECSRDGCSDQVTYICYRDTNNDEDKKNIHIDMAKELMFTEKI